ncbi:SprT family zinc-dependent metalloprotease [Wohlfahrtiimonas chitiniclastica]|uniref:M48 family metallopeptidase n=1 Tax=Wohlfahrtiimonas chitiniclastica TaxID=400946 RepID=UPI0007B403CF|nr:SprT family zinc-dependent metalloprotease [Wohlfahrtiimonas chitiniclastica]KZS23037.1 hypothetical protein BMY_0877 [Wohlfahrtiimonas chitiniclastica]WHR55469.1 SprT family zinc-dependent metalloprotease [Wohlfahrtiimonas chitiniclastica]
MTNIDWVVIKKPIKHLYIRIQRDGQVCVSAPEHLSQAALEAALLHHEPWVVKKLAAFDAAKTTDGVYLWGQPYVGEGDLDALYRQALNAAIPPLLEKWLPIMGVTLNEWRLKKMKTRWGTCNPRAQRIWLNVYLAAYPQECLEYVIVHELTHLLEASHNHRFKALMTHFLPDWRARAELLKTSRHTI